MDFDIQKIRDLMDVLGSPQRAYPSIHLTGTNGKTSTARMIDSLLRAHGLHTGRYTSPHLETVRERISLDGEPLSEEAFVATYHDVAPLAELVDAPQAKITRSFAVEEGDARVEVSLTFRILDV